MAEEQQKGQKPAPLVLSFIVCDDAIEDKASGKWSILGVFDNINAASFPAMHPKTVIMLEFTGIHGESPFEIRLVDAATDDILLQVQGKVSAVDPLVLLRFAVQLPPLTFQKEAECRWQLRSGIDLLIERRMTIKLVQPPQEPSNENG